VGGLIEIVQIFLPYRGGDWWDFFFDAVGALVGFWICLLINCWLFLRKTYPTAYRDTSL
jgi:VanZ family protein